MHRRARSILRGEQGLSMILVLCIGALFVALSAALVYAASVLTANANRQLLEQEAAQQRQGECQNQFQRRALRHVTGHVFLRHVDVLSLMQDGGEKSRFIVSYGERLFIARFSSVFKGF